MKKNNYSSIETIINVAKKGGMFILVDDEKRENEGDLIISSSSTNAKNINFMAKFGRGLICLALDSIQAKRLNLSLMSANNQSRNKTAFAVSIEAKKSNDGESSWEALIEHGREHSYIEAITWAQKACDMGAGEILVTSIDRDGTGLGLDLELIKRIRDVVNVPLICSGGVGTADDVVSAAKLGVNAVAIGKAFHYRDIDVRSVKETCCISYW